MLLLMAPLQLVVHDYSEFAKTGVQQARLDPDTDVMDAGIGRPAGRGRSSGMCSRGSPKEREDVDFAIPDSSNTTQAVLELGMEKAR